MEEVIKFKNVNKEYILNKKNNKNFIKNIFLDDKKLKKKVALNNVSFSIKKGEKVVILGKNGSGKTTILKLITGVSYPTTGEVTVNKKVNALLDINVGFEPDFTGRENIYLKGTLIGLKRSEIKLLENDIIEFADIGEYIDYPIKYYSSGMKARLGFSIATHIVPEILVIDEVLSVGDKQFRRKSLNRIIELTNKEDVTLVLVTHSDETAKDFCNRALFIDKGNLLFDGDVDSALDLYNNMK